MMIGRTWQKIACVLMGIWATDVWANEQVEQWLDEVSFEQQVDKEAQSVERRANLLSLIFAAETRYAQGKYDEAQGWYQLIWQDYPESTVAERMIEMALMHEGLEYAEQTHQQLSSGLTTETSSVLKRMEWMQHIKSGRVEQAKNDLLSVFQQVEDNRIRSRLFLFLAQNALENQAILAMTKEVYQAVEQYKRLPESTVAEAIFAAGVNDVSRAVAALNRLSQMDNKMQDLTQTVLRLMGRRHADVLNEFVLQLDAKELSFQWQEFKLAKLVEWGKVAEAQHFLHTVLSHKPDSRLYLLAIEWAEKWQQTDKIPEYLERLYQLERDEKKQSLYAINNVLYYEEQRNIPKMREWLQKVNHADDQFVKWIILGEIAQTPQELEHIIRQAERAKHKKTEAAIHKLLLLKYQLAKMYASKQPQKAVNMLSRLEREATQYSQADVLSEILLLRSRLYCEELGQCRRSLRDAEKLLSMNPEHPAAKNALGYVMLNQPKPDVDKAFALIQSAYDSINQSEDMSNLSLKNSPLNHAILDSLGWAYFLKNEWDLAQYYLQLSFNLSADPVVAAHLGEVLWHLGKRKEALRVWTAGMERDEWRLNQTLLKTLKRLNIHFTFEY